MKKNLHTYQSYVCEKCFEQIPNCKCKDLPWFLCNIDLNIQEHIRLLNRKNYKTAFCCEGHSSNEEIYITFNGNFRFDTLPEGFKYNGSKLSYDFSKNKILPIDYETKKKEMLNILLKWIKELPERKK